MKKVVIVSFLLILLVTVGFLIKGLFNTDPPSPTITIGEKPIPTRQGSYCWRGLLSGSCVDMISPPEIIKQQSLKPVIVLPEARLKVDFRNAPNNDTLGANIWNSNSETEDANLNGKILTAPKEKGVYVYEIYARWDKGSASYVFTIEVQ